MKSRIPVFLCLGVLALAAAMAPLALAHKTPRARAAATVSVSGKEFSFALSSKSAKAGSVTFRFTNKGKLKHDFKIAGRKTPVLKPGKSTSITVSLKKGSYTYLCTVKGHAASGMKGKFRVK